jgi:hypothetical protein
MKHRYVCNMGGIWRLNEGSYYRLCRAIKEGKEVDLDSYGRMVAVDPEPLSDIVQRIEDEQ